MKIITYILISIILVLVQQLFAQNIGVNSTGAIPHTSAILDVDASPTNNKGFLMPRLTTTQRLAITSPADGLQVYDINLKDYYYFNTTTNKWDCLSTRAGTVSHFANSTAPIGYVSCDGASYSITQYPELFNAIGYLYGGAGATFNVPDLRGEFVRGLDAGRGIDAGRSIGSFQKATTITTDNGIAPAVQGLGVGAENSLDANVDPITINWNSASNTGIYNDSQYLGKVRPRNVALLPCIKY